MAAAYADLEKSLTPTGRPVFTTAEAVREHTKGTHDPYKQSTSLTGPPLELPVLVPSTRYYLYGVVSDGRAILAQLRVVRVGTNRFQFREVRDLGGNAFELETDKQLDLDRVLIDLGTGTLHSMGELARLSSSDSSTRTVAGDWTAEVAAATLPLDYLRRAGTTGIQVRFYGQGDHVDLQLPAYHVAGFVAALDDDSAPQEAH